MRNLKKFFTLFLVLVMLCALAVPTFAETGNSAEPTPADTAEAAELSSDNAELAPWAKETDYSGLYKVDIDAYRAANNGAIDISKLDSSKLTSAVDMKTAREALGSAQVEELSDEAAYVRDVAASLTRPAGSQVEKSTGSVNVIIWLSELPEALAPIYNALGMQDAAYEQAKLEAVSARTSLKQDAKIKITNEYSYVFSGFAASVPANYLDTLAAMPGVYCITEEVKYELEYTRDQTYSIAGNLGARELFNLDALHAVGIDGTGVKVAVLDSGIQTNHPDLAAAYKGGWNYSAGYSGGGYNGTGSSDMSKPDGNHGTHVSGTIASQGAVSLGMAPGADLYMGQVFPNSYASIILAAIEDVTQDGESGGHLPKMDVVNCSFGSTGNNSAYDAEAYAMNNAALIGTMFVISAGNYARHQTSTHAAEDYRYSYSVNTPSAAATFGISVAATERGGNPSVARTITLGGVNFEVLNENADPDNAALTNDWFTGKEFFVALNQAPAAGVECTTAAYLQSLTPAQVAGKILVVGRGISFATYWQQAIRLNAAGLIIINREEAFVTNIGFIWNASETESYPAYFDVMPAFSAKLSAYTNVFSAYTQGTTTAGATNCVKYIPEILNQPADFSSIGPVKETAAIKPDIIAPGENILSTDLDSGYTYMGGTSMAAPCITGLYALLKGKYPSETSAQLKARLMNTADPFILEPHETLLPYDGQTGDQISIWEQGAGFVDIQRAVATNVIITVENTVTTANTNKGTTTGTMSSFSFYEQEAGILTDPITATVAGAPITALSTVARDGTRYSLPSAGVVTPILTNNGDGTFDLALNIDASAAEGLYEGYVKVTADGQDYYLPWGVRVGEAQEENPVPEIDMWTLFPERPITTSSNYTLSTAMNLNHFWFGFETAEDADTVALRYSGGTYYLDIYLLKASITPNAWTISDYGNNQAYRFSLGLGSSQYLSDYIDAGGYYYLAFADVDARARWNGSSWVTSSVTWPTNFTADTYMLAFDFNSTYVYGSGFDMMGPSACLTVNATRVAVQRLDNAATSATATTFSSLNNPSASTIYFKPVADGATEYTITGKVWSAALNVAENASIFGGFYTGVRWSGSLLLNYGYIYWVGQDLNGWHSATSNYNPLGFPYDEAEEWWNDYGDWWFFKYVMSVGLDGEFELTLPTSAFTMEENTTNHNRYFLNYTTGGVIPPTPTDFGGGTCHNMMAGDAMLPSSLYVYTGTQVPFLFSTTYSSLMFTPIIRSATHSINFTEVGGTGTIDAGTGITGYTYPAGTVRSLNAASFTVTPPAGYEIESVTYKVAANDPIELEGTDTFTIPAAHVTGNVVVTVTYSATVLPLRGDSNCSGTVESADATLVLRWLAGLEDISEQGLLNADVTDDGFVTASDAAKILRWLSGYLVGAL